MRVPAPRLAKARAVLARLGRILWPVVPAAVIVVGLLSVSNHVEAYEVGIAWNQVTGQLWLQPAGIHWSAPWVAVSRIDTRPQRVCVTSASKAFSCKLVRFEPAAYREFVAVEGHRYYWWSNRISFNLGYDEEYRGMRDLLRGYAYGAKQYPFVVTVQELSGGD